MKCMQHFQSDAVGICVSCGRGLCERCARKSADDRIVCSDDCEDSVMQISAQNRAMTGRLELESRSMRALSIVCRLMAIGCSIAGLANLAFTFVVPLYVGVRGAMKPIPAVGFGVIMFLFSAILVATARIARSQAMRYQSVLEELRPPSPPPM